ncbi:TOMM precursor leader peptide-binding protein [Paenibacillus macerans]|uniref:TOMM leader peptide-binding protein n=1 Tax=Paenibacillus macerans TaxID=44252 RepID=A0A6N8EUT2_PAEMA|nr:TOMM precursor leader peptide-binding protein [Paenibacillus macerans]MUG24006.1 TOMM precursor leader peptide-binding protein [Paenibacillus macerans]
MTRLEGGNPQDAAEGSGRHRRTVAVIGEGLLAELVYKELSAQNEAVWKNGRSECNERNEPSEPSGRIGGLPEETGLIVWICGGENPAADLNAEEALRQQGVPWLRCLVSGSEAVIGPLVHPETGGCCRCADRRREIAGRDGSDVMASLFSLLEPEETSAKAPPSYSGLAHAAYIAVNECRLVLSGKKARSQDHLNIVNLETLESSLHYVLPDPLCEVCGELPADSALAAWIELAPRPKASADSYRSRRIDDLKDGLIHDYLAPRTGVFNKASIDLVSPFAGAYVNMPSLMTGDEVSGGHSHRFAESGLTAILEGLERRCGFVQRSKRTMVREGYNRIAEEALDPATVGLYQPERYAAPDFPFEPFDPDRAMGWVWGYSFLRRRPILVPECLAYYSWNYGESFVEEGSNGCALGGSLEEAIFYGILEVAERDAFLITWYGQLPVPRLDPDSAEDRELRLMIERFQAVAGYEVYLFDMTMENRIPAILALAKSREPRNMNLICAAGSHLDPARAAKSAVHELGGLAAALNERFAERLDELPDMFHDPDLVLQMEDHALLNGLPQAEERFDFLLGGRRPMRTFAEQFRRKAGHSDLTEDLKDILQIFERLNLEVIVIDQTSPEISRHRLHCVKVLIPGMLPITFGHQLIRLNGLERVLRIPAELGYAAEPLTLEQLNPHPHPFV